VPTSTPLALADLLVEAGFTREDPVDEHGEFCVRGAIVDVFPAGAADPYRLEFLGDTIETIRKYDPSTQRSTGSVDHLSIVPLRDVFSATTVRPPPARRGVRSLRPPRGQPLYLSTEPEELDARS
jgi:transcription-repair coupling factor (superfamily II helicase)